MTARSQRTDAAYYYFGLEAGIKNEAEAREWAFDIIEKLEQPPAEVCELAVSKDLSSMMDSLKPLIDVSDLQIVGCILLKELEQLFSGDPSKLKTIVKQAMQVSRSTQLPEGVYFSFDRIDDGIHLAEQGIHYDIAMCCNELSEAFRNFCEGET